MVLWDSGRRQDMHKIKPAASFHRGILTPQNKPVFD